MVRFRSRAGRLAVLAATTLCAAGIALPASATIILVQASSIQGDNVLFNMGEQTGTTVFSAPSNAQIAVNGGGATLIANGGQARVSGGLDMSTNSPNDTVNFNALNFALTSGGTFNNLEFNLFGGDATSASFSLTDDAGVVFNFANLALGNGSNFFGFQGILGETIRSVAFTTSGGTGIQDIRQIRLDATPAAGAIPEPATWAMMLFGVGIAGYSLRTRRRSGVASLT